MQIVALILFFLQILEGVQKKLCGVVQFFFSFLMAVQIIFWRFSKEKDCWGGPIFSLSLFFFGLNFFFCEGGIVYPELYCHHSEGVFFFEKIKFEDNTKSVAFHFIVVTTPSVYHLNFSQKTCFLIL